MRAIRAGIVYDLGSGSNIDVCVLTKGKKELFRNLEVVGKKMIEGKGLRYRGGVEVLRKE